MELQLCQLYGTLTDSEGSNPAIVTNCGHFSIAAAYHTALGKDVGSLVFDDEKTRCPVFRAREIFFFPLSSQSGYPELLLTR